MKKTALLLDMDLVTEVKAILGTKTTTETVHLALKEVVDRAARERLVYALINRDGLDTELIQFAWDGVPVGHLSH
jgi:Arc/MetJ family transcription regulator